MYLVLLKCISVWFCILILSFEGKGFCDFEYCINCMFANVKNVGNTPAFDDFGLKRGILHRKGERRFWAIFREPPLLDEVR